MNRSEDTLSHSLTLLNLSVILRDPCRDRVGTDFSSYYVSTPFPTKRVRRVLRRTNRGTGISVGQCLLSEVIVVRVSVDVPWSTRVLSSCTRVMSVS